MIIEKKYSKKGQFKEKKSILNTIYSSFSSKNYTIFETCMFCKMPLGHGEMQKNRVLQKQLMFNPNPKQMIKGCPKCNNSLPSCAICLMPQFIQNPAKNLQQRFRQRHLQKKGTKVKNLSQGFVWCQMCRHCGHAEHLLEWFRHNNTCPVSDCQCQCVRV